MPAPQHSSLQNAPTGPQDPLSRAFERARAAFEEGEVPVGAVIVHEGAIIAEAQNAMRALCDPTAHAEILVIRMACQKLGTERLPQCDMYVTLEPCAMCAGAIAFARIRRLYYAAGDEKAGAVSHGVRFFNTPSCHHRPQVYEGLRAQEGAALMQAFFRNLRTR